jgi:hypothetical protein
VLSKKFGSRREEVTGDGRKFQNAEVRDLFLLPNIIRVIKSRHMCEKNTAKRVLVDKSERKSARHR